jgi:hypothetical protein
MKKFYLLLALGFTALSAAAQQSGMGTVFDTCMMRISTPKERAVMLTKIISDGLGLNGKQQEMLTYINEQYEQELQALSRFSNDPRRIEKPLKNLDKKYEKHLKRILSGQYKNYAKAESQIRAQLGQVARTQYEAKEKARLAAIAAEKARADSIAAANEAAQKAALKKKKKGKEKDKKSTKKKKK